MEILVRPLNSNAISLDEFQYNVLLSMMATAEDELDVMMDAMPLDLQNSLRLYAADFLNHNQVGMLSDVFVVGTDEADLAAMGEIVRAKLDVFNNRFSEPAQ